MPDERIFKVQINGEWVVTPFEDIKQDDIFTHSETKQAYVATSSPGDDGRLSADVIPCWGGAVCKK